MGTSRKRKLGPGRVHEDGGRTPGRGKSFGARNDREAERGWPVPNFLAFILFPREKRRAANPAL